MKKAICFLVAGFALLLFFTAFTDSDTSKITITGTVVTADTGEPLIGANVLLKNTTLGTVTDIDGHFTLEIEDSLFTNHSMLEINYIGYKTVNLTITKGMTVYTITLESDNTSLNEVVVVGYGSQKKSSVIGSISGLRTKPAGKRASKAESFGRDGKPFGTEEYGIINENRFYVVETKPLSTFSVDVDAASYSNVRRMLNNDQPVPVDAVRIEEMINYFDYQYPTPQGQHPFSIQTQVSVCPWNTKHQLLHVGLQGQKWDDGQLPAANLVFLLDVSGSMSDYNKLPLLKSALGVLVNNLRPIDKVSIVVYAGSAGMVLEPTPGANKAKILEALERLEAGGSTAGGQGIKLAYQTAREQFLPSGNNRVILATDGDFNVGVSSDAELVRMIEKERESGVFLTVLGFGMGNYKDNKMQQLADAGNGNHYYIDNESEAQKVLGTQLGGTLLTIAKDVKIQIEFNPQQIAGYRLIGYENRLLNDEDFEDDKKDAGEIGSGHTVTALYELIPVSEAQDSLLPKTIPLKYNKKPKQKAPSTGEINSKELATIKFRYKEPKQSTSQLLEQVIPNTVVSLADASENLRWAAAVAEFGMLLRKSEFIANGTYTQCIKLAEGAKGKDPFGYRKECIQLMEKGKLNEEELTTGKD